MERYNKHTTAKYIPQPHQQPSASPSIAITSLSTSTVNKGDQHHAHQSIQAPVSHQQLQPSPPTAKLPGFRCQAAAAANPATKRWHCQQLPTNHCQDAEGEEAMEDEAGATEDIVEVPDSQTQAN
jgi:hypothetical protein